MPTPTLNLSKSRLMASLQCLKRVHLEVHRPELARYSAQTQMAFAEGHRVGDLARQLYDPGGGVLVEYAGGPLASAMARTAELMNSLFPTAVFEATLEHGGVRVREDILLPVEGGGTRSWRMVEVKSSTTLKPEHLADCAVQAWVHRGAGHPLAGVALAHVDNTFVYEGEGRYQGLLVEHDVDELIAPMRAAVPRWVARAQAAVAGPLPEVPVGAHCTKPYECPFMAFCWPSGTDYPVQGLGGSKRTLGLLIQRGYTDIREVPPAELTGAQHERIHRVTRSGRPELLPGARAFARDLPYPRFYLDFETVGPAIPIWAGTRPYQQLPFQWSCHIEPAPGALEHRDFLDLSGAPPLRAFAESLIDALGPAGPVLVYTNFEEGILERLAHLLPDLAGPLEAIIERLVDLHVVTRENYYHPDMRGSWSIKAVLPTIAPDLDYTALEGIHEGTEASAAYLEAIAPDTTPARREEIRGQLEHYCRLDTEAMVRLLQFFGGG